MKIRKTMAVSAALMLGAAGLTACGGSTTDDTSGAAATGGGDTPVELSLWTNATTGDGKAFWDNAAVEFNKLYPNVTVTVQAIQNEDMDGKLQTALNSGDAPDIFMQRGGGNMAAQVDAGQLMDITDLISEDTHKVDLRRRARRRVGQRPRLRDAAVDPPRGRLLHQGPLRAGRDHHAPQRRSTSSTPSCRSSRTPGSPRSPSAPRTHGRPRTGTTTSPCGVLLGHHLQVRGREGLQRPLLADRRREPRRRSPTPSPSTTAS